MYKNRFISIFLVVFSDIHLIKFKTNEICLNHYIFFFLKKFLKIIYTPMEYIMYLCRIIDVFDRVVLIQSKCLKSIIYIEMIEMILNTHGNLEVRSKSELFFICLVYLVWVYFRVKSYYNFLWQSSSKTSEKCFDFIAHKTFAQ